MMKKISYFLFGLLIMTALSLGAMGSQPASAQIIKTITLSAEPTATPETPQPGEPTVPPFSRPLIVIDSYNTGDDTVSMGDGFNLNVRFKNKGSGAAYNVVASFTSAEFSPLETGGVKAVATLNADSAVDIKQPLKAHSDLWGYLSGSVAVTLNYTDVAGMAYTETFNITIPIQQPNYSAWAPTATPTQKPRAQLVVAGYSVDADPLQPGTIFNLKVEVRNLGSTTANNVTMVLGGGVLPPPPQRG